MPTYGSITYKAGFYNNRKNNNGEDDRVYTAEDIRKPYNSIYSKGIKPEADGTAGDVLKVSAVGGMNITVNAGEANLGAWFINESAFNITLDNATGADRYDCVIIQNDDSDEVRMPSIYIKSLSRVPTVNDLTRDDKIYEICVAYVRVPALATAITDADIIDTREDGSLCNTMRGVGATVIRTYRNTYFSETANQRVIPIGIPQFDKSRDDLTVIVNGRVFAEGDNYVIWSNSKEVSLNIGLPVVGTRIDFEVRKNVNAAGAETVVQEVGELRKEMTAANRILANYYYCNGVNDNINISNIVKDFLNLGFYHSLKLHIIGHFGFAEMAGGAGTASNPYKLFDFGTFADVPKPKVILDFTECEEISVLVDDGSYTIIFGGSAIDIIGANVYALNTSTDTVIRVFDNSVKRLKAEDCRFWLTGYKDCLVSMNGTFINCRGSIANIINNSYCFLPSNYGILRVTGGEYYAYTGDSTKQSSIVGQSSAEAVSILYGVSAPTTARSGFYQTNSILQWAGGGILSCTDLVSALPLIVVSGISNIRGTIAKSKANFT